MARYSSEKYYEFPTLTDPESLPLTNNVIGDRYIIDDTLYLWNGQYWAGITLTDALPEILLPSYTLSSELTFTSEGSIILINLSTNNVPDGTLVPYTISGVSFEDIGTSLTGYFDIISNLASINLFILADNTTEGGETLVLSLDNGLSSIDIDIEDTSLDPIPPAESTGIIGQALFTTVGSTTWTAPTGVTSVSVVAVGGGGGGGTGPGSQIGGGGGGGGGGLGWKNNITVVPGQTYTVVVGDAGLGAFRAFGGPGNADGTGQDGGDSYFISASTVAGLGGPGAGETFGATIGGGYLGTGGGNGGGGGTANNNMYTQTAAGGGAGGGGGGAGGYTGSGGRGGNATSTGTGPGEDGLAGTGGGGSGAGGAGYITYSNGIWADSYLGWGGGVGLLGQGPSGGVEQGQQLGTYPNFSSSAYGNPGSGGSINSGDFGGGGGGGASRDGGGTGTSGAGPGAVRIIWPGNERQFPTTRTTDETIAPADFTINVTNSGSSSYTFSGTDRVGAITGANPSLTFDEGDIVEFVVNASGHPFWIKTVRVNGTGNGAANTINNGTESGTIRWTVGAGEFYYICQIHSVMSGIINPVTEFTTTAHGVGGYVTWNLGDNVTNVQTGAGGGNADGNERWLYAAFGMTPAVDAQAVRTAVFNWINNYTGNQIRTIRWYNNGTEFYRMNVPVSGGSGSTQVTCTAQVNLQENMGYYLAIRCPGTVWWTVTSTNQDSIPQPTYPTATADKAYFRSWTEAKFYVDSTQVGTTLVNPRQ